MAYAFRLILGTSPVKMLLSCLPWVAATVDGYRTVFEDSFFRNGHPLQSLAFLSAGVGAILFGLGWFQGPRPHRGMVVWRVQCVLWLGLTSLFVALSSGLRWAYTRALRTSGCEVVEGTVKVLHRQPPTGHDAGDLVRVGGREFRVNSYLATPTFSRTIAHGGRVRLHHLDGSILKVEVAD